MGLLWDRENRVYFSFPPTTTSLAATSGATGSSCSVQPPPGGGSRWGRREDRDLKGLGENKGRKGTLEILQRNKK